MRPALPRATSSIWSLADQALVSGANFLSGILLARALGLDAFGAYVVAQTYLLYASTFQSALVVSPMMTAVPAQKAVEDRRALLRGFFGYSLLVILATVILVQLLAWLLSSWSPAIGLGQLALPLAAAMACFQLQDWLRRACYAESDNQRVFFADIVAYGGQLATLAMLASDSRLTADAALLTMALSFLCSSVLTLTSTRIWPEREATRRVITENWRASRNFLASWQLQWIASSGVILFGAGMVGQHAAGAIRAVQNLLGPVNVYFQWMDNVIPVRAALKLRDSGQSALRAYLWRLGWIGCLMLASFAAALGLVEEPLIVFLYGEEYRPFAALVVFQILYYLFGHAYRIASYFQRTLGETQRLAIASAWWAAVALTVAALSVGTLADRGIMLALVLGEIAGLIYLLSRHRAQNCCGTHVVLRRRDGSPHLLLPVANGTLLRSTLRMYFPSRITGKVYRWLLQWSLPLRMRLRMIETHPSLSASYPHLEASIGMVPGLSLAHCGILVSGPGSHSKLTLKLMSESGRTQAYARVAYGEAAIALVRREGSLLDSLRSILPGGSFPEPLVARGFSEPDVYCLIETAGPEAPASPRLAIEHFRMLGALVTNEAQDRSFILGRLAQGIRSLTANGPHEALGIAAHRCLTGCYIGVGRACIEHGDLAPWNIRMTESGRLYLLDWEHARRDGLPWMDALHFVFQMEVLVRRHSPKLVAEAMMQLFRAPVADSYAALFPELAGAESALAAAYLCRSLVEAAHTDVLDSPAGRMRLAVLKELIDEDRS